MKVTLDMETKCSVAVIKAVALSTVEIVTAWCVGAYRSFDFWCLVKNWSTFEASIVLNI